jgi:hypothetical protein
MGKVTISEMGTMLRGIEFEIEKVAVKNQFSTVLDTLIQYKSTHLQMVFFKGLQSTFLYRATIEDKSVLFAGDFSIGDLRNKVNNALDIDSAVKCDTLFVTDEEHFTSHRLIFEKNRLVKVILDFGIN